MAGSYENDINSVAAIFDSMTYGPTREDEMIAQAWLDEHGRKFGLFVNNKWIHPQDRKVYETMNPSQNCVLASTIYCEQEDIDLAVGAAKDAYKSWHELSGHVRARHIYSIARHIQKHARLLAVLESLDTGRTIRETRDFDVINVVRHLFHHVGWAQLVDMEMSGWKSLGVVAAYGPWNFPLLHLVWKVCPALAMGNSVVLKPSVYTPLTALLFAEICAEAGLPPGVFNVITGGADQGYIMAAHADVDVVSFTGSTETGQSLRRTTAGSGKKLFLGLGGKSPVIVFDSADQDSAVEGIVDAVWFSQGQVSSAGSRLLIQESIYDEFVGKVKARMDKLRLGPPLDKAVDMGAIVDENHKKTIESYVNSAIADGAEVYQVETPGGCFYPPTLITGVGTTSRCVVEEIFGPVIAAMPFRTAKEAVALANNTVFGLAASVFTEQLTLAVETAKLIKAGTVWINCHNFFDAAAGFGGYKHSGYGREGGKEGLYEYVKPCWQKITKFIAPKVDMTKFGSIYHADGPSLSPAIQHVSSEDGPLPRVDQTYKLYYGGLKVRPSGYYSRIIKDCKGQAFALVGESNRKDVRNAVEAAGKIQPTWEKRSCFNRSQILYYLAENLDIRRDEFVGHLIDITGVEKDVAEKEVNTSVSRLFHWAALCDKYGGAVQETQIYGTVLRVHEPIGVIGIACPDEQPLLSFISLIAPAIARGNAVVAVPSEKHPTPALTVYQIADTSDLPGALNILTGDRDHITKHLTEHQDVQAMWYFGSLEGSTFVEYMSSVNVKRTWVNYGMPRDWMQPEQGQGEEFLYHATQVKNIWLSVGDTYAN